MRISEQLVRKLAPSGLEVMKCEKVLQRMQDFPQTELNKSKDDNLKLQAVIADLRQVNRRWQSYNGDMQKLIKRLQTTIEDQQEQLNNMADYHAQKLLHTSQERDAGEGGCAKCQPVIDFLKDRIRQVEEEVIVLESHHGYSQHNAELVSLQLRLSQACQHIEYLNRIMESKGILKSGYNVFPDITTHHEGKLCSRDGSKFFECDSDLLPETSLEEICSRRNMFVSRSDSPSTSWEETKEQKDGKTSSEKHFQDSLSTASSEPPIDITNLCQSTNSLNRLISSDGSQIDNNMCKCLPRDKKYLESQNLKLASERLNLVPCVHAEGSNSKINCVTPLIDINSSLESNYNSHKLLDSPLIANSSFADQSKWWLGYDHAYRRSPVEEPFNLDRIRVGNNDLPVICPHCQTSFPPNSRSRFNNHLMSCQYL